MSVRRFFRLLRNPPSDPTKPDTLRLAVRDALHVTHRGFTGSSDAYKQVAEGHENYAKSFKKKR